MSTRAKIFKNGRSQAVRIPMEFRFECDEVAISREGRRVILEPIEKAKWPRGYWKTFGKDSTFETPPALPLTPISLD